MADESNEKSSDKDYQLKFVLLGDGTTGKTSIASRISQNSFTKNYDQTLGVDFFLRRMELPGGVEVAIQVWDIGGQTVGGKMLDNYIYGADAILFVYDITNYSSFANLDDWMSEAVRMCAKTGQKMPHLALVANKVDMEHMRTVKKERHKEFAAKHDMSSHRISAKTDDMVHQCFLRVAAAVLKVQLMVSDIEVVQKVVKPEIVPHVTSTSKVTSSQSRTSKTRSTICMLQ